jgi:hypothetical protein
MAMAQKQICRQWNQVKDQEIRSHCYSHVIFHNVFKNIMLDERHPLLEMVQGNRISTWIKLELDTYLSFCTKINWETSRTSI